MAYLRFLSLLVPSAYAVTIQRIGEVDPSVQQMWQQIMQIFPFTGVGAGGPLLLLLKVTNFVLTLIGGTAVCVLIYAGIRMIISQGDDSALAESKKTATYALVGVVLALAADAIVIYTRRLVETALLGT